MSPRGQRPVNLRLRRLLIMLPWLMEHETVSISQMAEHFSMSVEDLVADLTLVSMCGISQDPRDLIDLWVDENDVHFGIPKYFERPLRLTVPEAFSLIASAMAAQQIPGFDKDGSLSRAVAKVAVLVGMQSSGALAVELDAPSSLEFLMQASAAGEIIEFDYWSVASGDSEGRRVIPIEVFSENDHWYLRAHDLGVNAERTFRLDRLDALAGTSEFAAVAPSVRGAWFDSSVDSTKVVLKIEPEWLWVLEQYPMVRVDKPSDTQKSKRLTVRFIATTERWMQRLALRLGNHAEVLEPAQWMQLPSQTASLVLKRYGRSRG